MNEILFTIFTIIISVTAIALLLVIIVEQFSNKKNKTDKNIPINKSFDKCFIDNAINLPQSPDEVIADFVNFVSQSEGGIKSDKKNIDETLALISGKYYKLVPIDGDVPDIRAAVQSINANSKSTLSEHFMPEYSEEAGAGLIDFLAPEPQKSHLNAQSEILCSNPSGLDTWRQILFEESQDDFLDERTTVCKIEQKKQSLTEHVLVIPPKQSKQADEQSAQALVKPTQMLPRKTLIEALSLLSKEQLSYFRRVSLLLQGFDGVCCTTKKYSYCAYFGNIKIVQISVKKNTIKCCYNLPENDRLENPLIVNIVDSDSFSYALFCAYSVYRRRVKDVESQYFQSFGQRQSIAAQIMAEKAFFSIEKL